MQISVTGRHMEVTDALRDYAARRLEGELTDIPRVLGAHVILCVEKFRHIAEVVVQIPHHPSFESKEESEDMYVSIDRAVDKVAKQIRRLRDRIVDHKGLERTGGPAGDTQT